MMFRVLCLAAALLTVVADQGAYGGPTTYDGKHDITKISLTAVYFVPKDRVPLADWKDRVGYYLRRMSAFHHRELDGISSLQVSLHPTPLVSAHPSADFRRGNQDATFFKTVDDVKALLSWKPTEEKSKGFPILLIFSDINWREMDDFSRTRIDNGKTIFEGHVANNGRHFPGAESGGARAAYLANPGYGMGLVSGDGWRVPYSGSDCVAYHEGVGHCIGLPHPEPPDDSVMGTGQYRFWLSETYLNASQKRKLGWTPPSMPVTPTQQSGELFRQFTALPDPIVPAPGQDVKLALRWPKGASVKSWKVRTQTELRGSWVTTPSAIQGKPPVTIPLGRFETSTPVSYRVDVVLDDGQDAELWGYFQVRK